MTEISTGGSTGSSKGLLHSLTALATTLVAITHVRLSLLSTDLEEAREHLLSLLVLTMVSLFFLGIGVVLATVLLVVAFWDTHRLLVLGEITGFYLVLGLALWLVAIHKAKTKPRLFAASLSELFKDRQQLASRL